MPIYEYRCPSGHRSERIRPYAEHEADSTCPECGLPARRIISAHHVAPDGVYSYAPNLGSAAQFERRQQAMRDGVKVIRKEA